MHNWSIHGYRGILNRIKGLWRDRGLFRSSFGLFVSWEVRDAKTGKLISKGEERPSRGFCQAFLQVARANMHTADTVTGVIDVTNTSRNVTDYASNLFWLPPAAADDDRGILVGTGTNAEAYDDYNLQTKIVHGTGAGELEYDAMAYTEVTYNSPYVELEGRRTFNNSSGGSITVEEVGIVGVGYSSGSKNFLFARDLTGGVAVADGQTLTVKYIMRTIT